VRNKIIKNHALNDPCRREMLLKRRRGENHFSKKPGYESKTKGSSHPNYDHNLYTFINKHTNEIICATQRDMLVRLHQKHRSSNMSMLISGKRKSFFGWKILSH
jgi:hypothetical protein